jgi:hypothetical protein
MKTRVKTMETDIKGPWRAKKLFGEGARFAVFYTDDQTPGKWQRRIDTQGQFSEERANLIAAAPQLLADALAVLDLLENEGRDTGVGGPISDLRDAIAQATGKAGA